MLRHLVGAEALELATIELVAIFRACPAQFGRSAGSPRLSVSAQAHRKPISLLARSSFGVRFAGIKDFKLARKVNSVIRISCVCENQGI